LFDFLAPDWLNRRFSVFRCVLIGCINDVVCYDMHLLIGCTGAEVSLVA